MLSYSPLGPDVGNTTIEHIHLPGDEIEAAARQKTIPTERPRSRHRGLLW